MVERWALNISTLLLSTAKEPRTTKAKFGSSGFALVWRWFLWCLLWSSIRHCPTTTMTIFEFILGRPTFQLWVPLDVASDAPSTQRKCKDFSSDVSAEAGTGLNLGYCLDPNLRAVVPGRHLSRRRDHP